MFGDKFNFGSIMKNAKKMQEMLEQTQAELAKVEVTGEAGAGAVKVKMNARYSVLDVQIDDDTMKEDKNILQELIAAAINDATAKIEEVSKSKMAGAANLFGGLNIEDK